MVNKRKDKIARQNVVCLHDSNGHLPVVETDQIINKYKVLGNKSSFKTYYLPWGTFMAPVFRSQSHLQFSLLIFSPQTFCSVECLQINIRRSCLLRNHWNRLDTYVPGVKFLLSHCEECLTEDRLNCSCLGKHLLYNL